MVPKMALIDTSYIGSDLLISLTNNITGDMTLSLIMIMFIMICFCLGTRVPLILTIPLVLPFSITATLLSGAMFTISVLMFIYLAITFTRDFFLFQG